MKNFIEKLKFKLRLVAFGIKPVLVGDQFRRRWAIVPPDLASKLKSAILEEYFESGGFSHHPADYIETTAGKEDMEDHLHRRLNTIRVQAIPWIDDAKKISGSKILEVGCGTGASTVAFCEQGASVTALDIDEASIRVARTRCEAYSLECKFIHEDCVAHLNNKNEGKYDIITFMAVLEHMTPGERVESLRAANSMLKDDGVIVIYETPNRLWYYDKHTTQMNFYNWLPEDLAIEYSKYVQRPGFYDSLYEAPNKTERLSRWGRGISFHDFCIIYACEKGNLPVVSSMEHFIRKKTNIHRLPQFAASLKYENFICEVEPGLWEGFSTEYLNIILRKVSRESWN